MGTSFEDILNRMKNAPHNGIPPVTNPKVPTKVERDVAAFDARQRVMPKFHFGTGSQLEQLVEHMKNTPHSTPNYADPKFHGFDKNCVLSKSERDAFESNYQVYAERLKAKNAKRKQEAEKAITNNGNEKADT